PVDVDHGFPDYRFLDFTHHSSFQWFVKSETLPKGPEGGPLDGHLSRSLPEGLLARIVSTSDQHVPGSKLQVAFHRSTVSMKLATMPQVLGRPAAFDLGRPALCLLYRFAASCLKGQPRHATQKRRSSSDRS